MARSRGFGQFSRRMKLVAEGVTENVVKHVRRAAIEADRVAVTETPVDTGRARSNWIASIGTPRVQNSAPSVEGDKNAATVQATLQAASVIKQWKLGAGPINLTNSVPYIIPLDNGSSDQSLEGMSRAAIAAARRVLRDARLLKGV